MPNWRREQGLARNRGHYNAPCDPIASRGSSGVLVAMLAIGVACGVRARRRSRSGRRPRPFRSRLPTPSLKWRAKHEADYRRDWVSIAGLHTLKPGVNTAGSAPTNDIVLPQPVPPRSGASCCWTGWSGSSPRPARASC